MTNEISENEKLGARAFAQGFINHAVVGLGKTPEVAGERYKRANTIRNATIEKFGKIVSAVRQHINAGA